MKCDDCGMEVEGNVCKNCGFVIEDHPIQFEYIPNGNGDERNDDERELALIKWYDPDISFKTYHSKKTGDKNLRWAFNTEKITQEKCVFGKAYLNGMNEINRICNSLRLSSNISDTAILWLRKLTEEGFIKRSYKKYSIYPALVMLSARYVSRLPISFYELGDYSDEDIKSIISHYRKLKRKLEIATNPFYLEEIMNYHCNILGIDKYERKRCLDLAKKVEVKGGKMPYGYSAAIIKIVTKMSRRKISGALHVSEPTITQRVREISKYD